MRVFRLVECRRQERIRSYGDQALAGHDHQAPPDHRAVAPTETRVTQQARVSTERVVDKHYTRSVDPRLIQSGQVEEK